MLVTAIRSVLDQGYPNLEHIVVDANSTDETVDVLQRFPHLRVLREADRGVYDGLNKGIGLARGEIVGHLNSDDIYLPGALNAVGKRFAADPELEALSGGATMSTVTDAGERRVDRRYQTRDEIRLSFASGTTGAPLPNARFFRRRLYRRVGRYDISLPIAADRDFLIRVVLARAKAVEIDMIVYDYLQHPGSLSLHQSTAAYTQSYLDLLQLAERYMHDPAMPVELRERCLTLHRDIARGASLNLLAARDWPTFCRIFPRGGRSDRLWPVRFAALAVRRGVPAVMRRVARRLS
jgi:glycosyltransferase involved in cell wall biosynthesis